MLSIVESVSINTLCFMSHLAFISIKCLNNLCIVPLSNCLIYRQYCYTDAVKLVSNIEAQQKHMAEHKYRVNCYFYPCIIYTTYKAYKALVLKYILCRNISVHIIILYFVSMLHIVLWHSNKAKTIHNSLFINTLI